MLGVVDQVAVVAEQASELVAQLARDADGPGFTERQRRLRAALPVFDRDFATAARERLQDPLQLAHELRACRIARPADREPPRVFLDRLVGRADALRRQPPAVDEVVVAQLPLGDQHRVLRDDVLRLREHLVEHRDFDALGVVVEDDRDAIAATPHVDDDARENRLLANVIRQRRARQALAALSRSHRS